MVTPRRKIGIVKHLIRKNRMRVKIKELKDKHFYQEKIFWNLRNDIFSLNVIAFFLNKEKNGNSINYFYYYI